MKILSGKIMHKSKIKKLIGAIIVFFTFLAAGFFNPAFAYGPTKTHPNVTAATLQYLEKSDKDGLYKEVYHPTHFEKMKKGARDQDFGSVGGNGRGFRHYYDPDTS